MKCSEHKKSKKGYVLLAIGGLMLIGLLHLGFLIPFAIAAFLIYKGWNMIKPPTQPFSPETSWPTEAYPVHTAGMGYDPIDEWEKQVQK